MKLGFPRQIAAAIALGLSLVPSAARAVQTAVDQADPSVVEDQLQKDERTRPKIRPTISIARPRSGANEIGRSFVAGAIRIQGAAILQRSAFAKAIESYVGRTLAPDDLQALATAIADVARSAGYGLATAWIPEQRIDSGVLTVMLDEGRIDAVEISGNALVVRQALASIVGGRPVRTDELERQLLIAGDQAGVKIGKVRFDRRGDRNILTVEAVQKRIEAAAYLDNWGSSTVGPVRARLAIDFNGLLSGDDQLSVGGVLTPLQPKEFALAHATYTIPVGSRGTEMSFGGYYAYSEPGGVLSDRDIDGRSAEAQATVRHPIVRTRSSSLWSTVDFRVRDVSQRLDGARTRADRLTILGGNLFAIQQVPEGRIRAKLAVARGLSLFDATGRLDPLASRSDASGVFSKLETWLEYEQGFGREVSLLFRSEGQIADRPLLSSEEMGLGGRSFGRAWDYREFSGDRGLAGSMELRYDVENLPAPIWMLQIYGYADAGKVSNYRGGFGGGSLASAGGGLRLWLRDGLEAGAEAAFPLTDGANAAGRDPRFSFMVGGRF